MGGVTDTFMGVTTKIDELIDFAITNGEGRYTNINREDMAKALSLHFAYGTIMVITDPKGLLAIARWNWVDIKTVHILDVIIRKDSRSTQSLKGLLTIAIQKHPQCERITFQRQIKTGKETFKTYKVKDFLRRR